MKTPYEPSSNRSRVFGNERGQSIVQVLISAAIMGFLLMVMVSVQTMQQRENRALTEKLSALDVMRTMTATVSNQTACGEIIAAGNLVNASQLPISAATAANISATNPYVIKLKEIPSAKILPGSAPSVLSDTLKLASSAAPQSGLQIVFTTPTTASLQVNFDQAQLVRPLRNLSFQMLTSVVAGSTTITGCQGLGGSCPAGQTMTGINSNGTPQCSAAAAGGSCPAGQTVTGINPNGTPQCTAAAGGVGGACPAGQLMIGINPNGTPQCTTNGSQAGAPCTYTDRGMYVSHGITTTTNSPGGNCCLIGDAVYGASCMTPDP